MVKGRGSEYICRGVLSEPRPWLITVSNKHGWPLCDCAAFYCIDLAFYANRNSTVVQKAYLTESALSWTTNTSKVNVPGAVQRTWIHHTLRPSA